MSKSRMRKVAGGAALAVGVGVVFAAGNAVLGNTPGAPGAPVSTVATARSASLAVFDRPDAPATAPAQRLTNPRPSGAPLVLLVTDEQPQWLHVMLPERPNGSTGWVHRADVTTRTNRFRVVVSLGTHELVAYDGSRVVMRTPVAVGAKSTPTPVGRFFTTELLQPPSASGPYGPYAFGLSAHSDVLTDFAGGDGTVGIHGTNDPSTLGTDVSHGCVRIGNDAITTLARSVPLGTPVTIEH